MFHLDIFQYLVNTSLDLVPGHIAGQTQLSSIVERTLDRQIAVDTIVLRHITKLCTKSGEMMVVILTVVEDGTSLGRNQTIQSIHQGRFTCTRATHQSNKLTRRNCNRNVVDQDGI